MKRITCIFLTAVLLFCLCVQGFCSTDGYSISLSCDGNGTVTVLWNIDKNKWNTDIAPAEKYMSNLLEGLLKDEFTLEEIKSDSRYSFLTDKIIPFVRFCYNGYYSSFPLTAISGKKNFSVYSDIIPGFSSLADFTEGGTITAELVIAPESYPKGTDFFFSSLTVECSDSFEVKPTGRIIYVQDDNTVNKNPACFALPLTKDIILNDPELTGNTFAGWECNGVAIDRINAGTENITVVVNFTPCEYRINYVMTTDITYSFGRADNSQNPQSYSYGTAAPLYSIKSPVGGYTFYGWFLNGKLVAEIPVGTMGDVVLYAKWLDDESVQKLKAYVTYKEILDCSFCDLNTDGTVTIDDARITLRISIGLTKSTNDIRRRADVDANGYINVKDARKILRIALNKENILNVYTAYCG